MNPHTNKSNMIGKKAFLGIQEQFVVSCTLCNLSFITLLLLNFRSDDVGIPYKC